MSCYSADWADLLNELYKLNVFLKQILWGPLLEQQSQAGVQRKIWIVEIYE